MENRFELKVGMTTQQVLQNINSINTTAKTKQFIINFCNSDHDKKITNDIELTMLNSWASGSEKVKMPDKLEQYDSFENLKDCKECSVDREPGNRDILIDYDKDGYADSRKVYTTKIGQNNGPKLWLFEDEKLNGELKYSDFWDLDNK